MSDSDNDDIVKTMPGATHPAMRAVSDMSWSESQTTEASIHLLLPNKVQRPPAFRQITGPGAPRDMILSRDKMTLGRSKAADFTVDSPELSRVHLRIEKDGIEFTITDELSRNGVFLNGVKIHAAVLRPGDAIQVGNVTFLFHEAL